ncbi:MAG: leucine-rich repeat domain-containing protein [Paludibacteraceae bacterium]|nr:leucine-rich repeat domain-containing protein [Paludibacteraceae bacterium]
MDEYSNPLRAAKHIYLNGEEITDLVISGKWAVKQYSFLGCKGLITITFPESLTTIGKYAFQDCSNIKVISLPQNVTEIGVGAFNNSAKTIIVNSSIPPTLNGNAFVSSAVIYVPCGSADTYQSANYWKNYTIKELVTAQSDNNYPTSIHMSLIYNALDVENKVITFCGIEGGEQQAGNTLEYISLEPESEYKDIPIALTYNTGETETVNVSFTTTALELTTKPSKPVSATTAILLAETNMSDAEVSCGFEYKRNDAPEDMSGTKVYCPVASGQMAGRLKNLRDDVYYKYRAFYQSAAGNMYYGDWQYIFTGDVAVEFDPVLYTYTATAVTETTATISGYALAGAADFTEQGFEYWAESRTDGTIVVNSEHFFVQTSGISMHATLTGLDAGTVYKYRAYAKVGEQYYYGSEQSFTTQGEWVEPEEQGIEDVPTNDVQSTKVQKILYNGQILILRGEKVYTITGQQIH